ncbi:ATP synthase F1 subunit delta [Calditrichota bacterium LG25]
MNRVAKRYTKAIFQLAQENNILEQIEQDFLLLSDLLRQSDELDQFLANPLIREDKKMEALEEMVGPKANPMTKNFLRLLATKRRLRVLPAILENFRQMMLEYRNIVEGEVVSAVELDESQLAAIKKRLEEMWGKNVKLYPRVQPDILGGFVVRVQDVVIDNSIRLQLNKLREKLTAR